MADFEPNQETLRSYVRIIRRRLHWLVAFTILAVAVATAFSSLQPKRYSATTQLLVQPTTGSVPISGTQQTVSPTDVLTDLQLVTSGPVEAAAAKKLGYAPSISASEVGQTNVIALTATASTPARAADAANAYTTAFVADQRTEAINALTSVEQQLQSQINGINHQLQPLEAEINPSSSTSATVSALSSQESVLKEELAQLEVTGAVSPGGVEIVSRAGAPKSPSSPKPVRDGLIGLLIGLLLGIGAAFAAEYFDDKVYTKDQAERLTGGVPVLAMIPKVPGANRSDTSILISESDPFSPATEAYRSLRTSMQFAGHNGRLKTILVTSASGSEGKTSTVANLAVVLAKAGERVVVVGCDLRRPRIGGILGRGETPGFTNVLLGRDELKSTLQNVSNAPGLALLATGLIPPNPAELLGSEKAGSIFRLLTGAFDTVIIDSPPLLPVADALILARYADAVLLVVAAGQTSEAELRRATELLEQVEMRPTGIVLNKLTRFSGVGSEYGYGYGHKYRYTPLRAPEVTLTGNANGNGHGRSVPSAVASDRRPVL